MLLGGRRRAGQARTSSNSLLRVPVACCTADGMPLVLIFIFDWLQLLTVDIPQLQLMPDAITYTSFVDTCW